MTEVRGVTWRAENGEISERRQFRVGYVTSDSYEAYFPIGQLADLIAVLQAVVPLGIEVLALGTDVQARKVSDGFQTDTVVEPRSNLFPPQIMRFEYATITDLTSTLQALQAQLSLEDYGDWDDNKPNPVPPALLPDYLQQDALSATFVRAANDSPIAAGEPSAAGNVVDRRAELPSRAVHVVDSVHEWWLHPVATRIGRTTYGAGYSSTGEVIMWDRSDRNGLDTVVIADAGVNGPGGVIDDHDAPARWVSEDARRSVAFWTNHGGTNYISARVSLDGTAVGFLDQPEQSVSVGSTCSYTQVFLHSSSGDVDTFWVFCRLGVYWGVKTVTVDWESGEIAGGTLYTVLQIGGQQPYVSATMNDRGLRFAAYVNPANDVHAIWLLHLDMDMLTVTNPIDSGFSHVITGPAMDLSSVTPFVPETATTAESRRLFYVHPTEDRVLYAEWARGSEDDAIYREAVLFDGSVTTRSVDVHPAGPRIGYSAGSNYLAGAAYSPNGTIVTAHNSADGTEGALHIHTASESWVTRRTGYPVSRPLFINDNELMWLAIDHYTDYWSFLMHQVSQVGLPSLEAFDPADLPRHPLWTEGTLYLTDPTFESWAQPAWPAGIPAQVTNLADSTSISVASTVVAGIVERTTKGGLHVAVATSATTSQYVALRHAATLAYMQANPGHSFLLAESFAVTRAMSGSYTASPGHRFVGAATNVPEDRGDIRVAVSKTAVTVYVNNNTAAPNRQTAAVTVGGPRLVMGEVSGMMTPFGSSDSVNLLHNGGSGSPALARATYFTVVEDLTVSGRSYATAAAAVQAFHDEVHGSGGRYYGDTWTAP